MGKRQFIWANVLALAIATALLWLTGLLLDWLQR